MINSLNELYSRLFSIESSFFQLGFGAGTDNEVITFQLANWIKANQAN